MVEQKFGRRAIGFEAYAPGGEYGAEAANADALVGVIVDEPGLDAEDALAFGREYQGINRASESSISRK